VEDHSRNRPTFTSEFKFQAVQLVPEKGFSHAEQGVKNSERPTF